MDTHPTSATPCDDTSDPSLRAAGVATSLGDLGLPPSKQVTRRGHTVDVDVATLTAAGFDRLWSLSFEAANVNGFARLSFRRYGPLRSSCWMELPWWDSMHVLAVVVPNEEEDAFPGSFALVDARSAVVCDCSTFADAEAGGWSWWEPGSLDGVYDGDGRICRVLGEDDGCIECERCSAVRELERLVRNGSSDAVCVVFTAASELPLVVPVSALGDVDVLLDFPHDFAQPIGPVEAHVRELAAAYVRAHRRVPQQIGIGWDLWTALRDEISAHRRASAPSALIPFARDLRMDADGDEVVVHLPQRGGYGRTDRVSAGHVSVPLLTADAGQHAIYAQLRAEGTPAQVATDIAAHAR